MLEINFGPFPILKTERLELRPMLESDDEALFGLRSNLQVMRYFDSPLMKSKADAALFIQRVVAMFTTNEGIQWGIALQEDPTLIGTITYWKIDKENHRAITGYMLHPDYQGRGIMSEALKAVLKYGFTTMNLHSVEANVNPENQDSIKLLERHGFVQEAHFRENFYFDGKFLDSLIFSLLARNYKN